jgi:hypothetical protein
MHMVRTYAIEAKVFLFAAISFQQRNVEDPNRAILRTLGMINELSCNWSARQLSHTVDKTDIFSQGSDALKSFSISGRLSSHRDNSNSGVYLTDVDGCIINAFLVGT